MSRAPWLVAPFLLLMAGTAAPMSMTGRGSSGPAAAIAARIRHSYLGSARACYERARKQDPGLEGRLDLVITVGRHGRVTRASVASSALGPKVEGCLASAARAWTFQRPRVRRAIRVTYPFVFRASR